MALNVTCVEKNLHNTIKHRLTLNGQRMVSRAMNYDENFEVRTKLNEINGQLAKLDEEQHTITAKKKALREEKKQTSGGKKWKTKVALGRRPTLPGAGAIVGPSFANENEAPFLSTSLLAPVPLELDPELEPLQPSMPFPCFSAPSSSFTPD
jgi:hypothetical protein